MSIKRGFRQVGARVLNMAMDKIFFFFFKKREGPIAVFFKCGNSSTTKNAALNMGYSRMYKTWLHMNNLSHVFKKHGFNPSVAVFLKTWPKKTQPKTHMFCSED